MNDSVKKVAIPTLGIMMIADWILGIDPTTLKIVFGIFIAATGLPILGMVYNGLKVLMTK